MLVSLPEGEVGVSVSFRTISLPFEAIRAEYLSRTQWLRKGRPSCPFCTRYKLAPWPKTDDRYNYILYNIYIFIVCCHGNGEKMKGLNCDIYCI